MVVYGDGAMRVERRGLEGARVKGLEIRREGGRGVVGVGGR